MAQGELLKTAVAAAIKAGAITVQIYNKPFRISHKSDASPLTEADLASNRMILKELSQTGIPVLSEESSILDYDIRKTWKSVWIVDPLDGTKEFISRNGEFTVNIALIQNGSPTMGVVYAPVLQLLYFAAEEYGSYFLSDVQPDTGQCSFEVLLSSARKLPEISENRPYTVVASRSHLTKETSDYLSLLQEIHPDMELISKGSSLKLCLVAQGKADIYPRLAPTMEWDIAAGHAIIRYAGGSCLDFTKGTDLIYNKNNLTNPWFVAQRIKAAIE